MTAMEENIQLSSSSHPLFSCFVIFLTLILIYFPIHSLQILLSPVLLITGALLFLLFRHGSIRQPDNIESVNHEESEESLILVHDLMGDFVEWNLRAPLEVIHEAYEEEDEDDEENPNSDPTRIERFPSLSLCYPESDSESDSSSSSSEFNFPDISHWISPEKREEEEDEGLIEIKLSESHRIYNSKVNQTEEDFHGEEDGLIEIDLSP